jgi:hypothetical protein
VPNLCDFDAEVDESEYLGKYKLETKIYPDDYEAQIKKID